MGVHPRGPLASRTAANGATAVSSVFALSCTTNARCTRNCIKAKFSTGRLDGDEGSRERAVGGRSHSNLT
eukprot:3104827-Prymnesium_polylepis.1